MKKFIIILLSVLFVQDLSAQMDEMFYHPDKEWLGIEDFDYREIVMHADGDTICSVVIAPARTPKATVIYFHGNSGNISKWLDNIRPLVADGFQVCMLDYRGFGKSTGKPTHLNIARDAQMWFERLLELEEVAGTKLIVYGASIGSQVAAHLAKNNKGTISALVLDGMFASFTDIALLNTPAEIHEQVRQSAASPYSAKEDIKDIGDVEVLFIHSEEDFIPIAGAREVYDSVTGPKTFWEYEGGHVQAPITHREEFLEYMNELL